MQLNKTHITVNDCAGLTATLNIMFYLERLAIIDRNFFIWARRTFQNPNIEKKLHTFIINSFVYKVDDYDETLTSPQKLLITRAGDCDDFALFAKTCLTCTGINSRYLLAGRKPGVFTHIVTVTETNVIIDGTNKNFNVLPKEYKYTKYV